MAVGLFLRSMVGEKGREGVLKGAVGEGHSRGVF